MSASYICPQCNGTTFRSPDGEPSFIICECVEFDDANEEAEQLVFKALHDAITADYDRALNQPAFCGALLHVARLAVKLNKPSV